MSADGAGAFGDGPVSSNYDDRVDQPDDARAEPAGEATVAQLWAAEIERRSNRARSGESRGIPWEVVKQRIEQELLEHR